MKACIPRGKGLPYWVSAVQQVCGSYPCQETSLKIAQVAVSENRGRRRILQKICINISGDRFVVRGLHESTLRPRITILCHYLLLRRQDLS